MVNYYEIVLFFYVGPQRKQNLSFGQVVLNKGGLAGWAGRAGPTRMTHLFWSKAFAPQRASAAGGAVSQFFFKGVCATAGLGGRGRGFMVNNNEIVLFFYVGTQRKQNLSFGRAALNKGGLG